MKCKGQIREIGSCGICCVIPSMRNFLKWSEPDSEIGSSSTFHHKVIHQVIRQQIENLLIKSENIDLGHHFLVVRLTITTNRQAVYHSFSTFALLELPTQYKGATARDST